MVLFASRVATYPFRCIWLLCSHITPILPVPALLLPICLDFDALSAVHVIDKLALVISTISPYQTAVAIKAVV